MKTLSETDAVSLLEPQSIKSDPTVQKITKTLNPVLLRLFNHLHDGLFLYRIDELSSEQLDHLATQWSPMTWRDTWPVETKRAILKSVVREKSRVGTRASVVNTLSSFGSAAKFVEWFEESPQKTPHTFKITINQNDVEGTVSSETTTDLIRSVERLKPVRSQYDLTIVQTDYGQILLHTAGYSLSMVRVGLDETLNNNVKLKLAFGGAGLMLTISRGE